MSTPISYANIAAKGTAIEREVNTPVDVNDVKVEGGAKKESSEVKVEKKILAPAPVPETSAWGATPSSSSSSNEADDRKWPTPDNQIEKGGQQKFIKPATNKWVPINAKVILQSSRSPTQKPNRNRKKTPKAPKKSQTSQTSISKVPGDELDPEANLGDSVDSAADPAEHVETEGHNIQNGYQNFQYQKFQQNGQNGQNGKNFRRFNNGNNGTQYNKRFSESQPQQNGYYQPLPYVNNFQNAPNSPQNFQNNFQNNIRQFRPQQFRPQGNLPQFNGYLPSQPLNLQGQIIPPPISPKQDPQQALTQQIDYYFSLENLLRDIYLRKNMTPEGWVSLSLILEFKRVKIIVNGIQNTVEEDHDSIVLNAIKECQNLEIDYLNEKTIDDATIGDINLRVKDNYLQWLLPEA